MKAYLLFFTAFLFAACSKSDFLDIKPDPSLVVPETIADYQAILDNDATLNGESGYGIVPALGECGADNYFITSDIYNSALQPLYKRVYTWEKNVFTNEQIYDWNAPYQSVFTTNLVLEGIDKIVLQPGEEAAYDKVKGSALFYRAHSFFQLAQVFASPYNKDNATTILGIPLRLTSSVNEKLSRATLEDTYNKIIEDLKTAVPLLPSRSTYATQPSKASCYGLLARLYLTQSDYQNALLNADSCLALQHELIDYNTLDATSDYPFEVMNKEVVFQCEMTGGADILPINPNYAYVDTILYNNYDENDVRKTIYFKPRDNYHYFSGSYSGFHGMFAGIGTDEMYLTRAECYARLDNNDAALEDVNTLLEQRFKTGSFIPYTQSNTPDVLALVQAERRKELCFRALRWTDVRRLNISGAAIILYRNIDGNIYTLNPNDKRYVYPIPEPVLSLNPAIIQNER